MPKRSIVAAVCIGSLWLAYPALAVGPGGLTRGLHPSASFMDAHRTTLAPFAHVRFCLKNRDKCLPNSGEEIIDLTGTNRAELDRVNRLINKTIVSVSDANGSDEWQVNVAQGDCEDFALTKRDRLIAAGFSSRALRLAVAQTSSGEGHAVLVVRTTSGDLVLDNRTDKILNWDRAELQWIKIQSDQNPRVWLTF